MTANAEAVAQLALFDDLPDLVIVKDRAFKVVYANSAWLAMTGRVAAEVIGRQDVDFVAPTAVGDESYRSLDLKVLSGQAVHGQRVTAKVADVVRTFDVHKLPMRDARGEVWGIITVARDVTAAYRAEQALRASEMRYRLLLDHSPVAMYVHDGRKILYANRAFAALVGASEPAAMLGYPILALAPEEERPKLTERVRRVQEGKVVSPLMSFRALGVDGRELYVDVLATRCEFEERPAIQVVMIDLTERRRAALEREALEAQLRHAQRLDALGRLAGGIAHDFNNLLLILQMHMELVSRRLPPDDPGHADVEQMRLAIARGTDLVRGILSFSRKQPVERRAINLEGVVEESMRLLRATLPAGVALDVELTTTTAVVVADATQLNQAIINLGTNAWQAMVPDRSAHIRVGLDEVALDEARAKLLALPGPGRYARISVEDNGAGMDEDTVRYIFDPFFTTKPAGKGTGLGLSVVDGIVRAHNGAVEVVSTLGSGSTFRIYLPIAAGPAAGARLEASAEPRAMRTIAVLLVDDEPAVRSGTQRVLEDEGFHVRACDSLATARAALSDARIDVLVVDHNMPDGTGVDLAEIAARERPRLPIVLVSGYLDEPTRARAARAGVRTVLLKPYSPDELIEKIGLAMEAADPTGATRS